MSQTHVGTGRHGDEVVNTVAWDRRHNQRWHWWGLTVTEQNWLMDKCNLQATAYKDPVYCQVIERYFDSMGIHRHPEINKYVASRVNAWQRGSSLRNQYWLAVIHSWSTTYTGFFSCYISLHCIYGGTWMMWNPHEIKSNWSHDDSKIYI